MTDNVIPLKNKPPRFWRGARSQIAAQIAGIEAALRQLPEAQLKDELDEIYGSMVPPGALDNLPAGFLATFYEAELSRRGAK